MGFDRIRNNMIDKKYKVTCKEIGYEDTIKASNDEDAECFALVDVSMNLQEYIDMEVREVK
jgi:hypothetical protein